MATIVSEWNLVCGNRWIVAFIISIQMFGMLVGFIIVGYIADLFGRKPTIFAGLTSTTVSNFVGYFASSYEIYCGIRFEMGIGLGFFYTVQKPYMAEVVPSRWRSFVTYCPIEPVVSMLFAFVAWWLHDWKQIHLLLTLIGVVISMAVCFAPESFRWLVLKMKFDRAEQSVSFVAYMNSVQMPNLKYLFDSTADELESLTNGNTKHNITILWSSRELRKITLSLSLLWFSVHGSWYAMSLGMDSISVNIYITIFLINLVDVPTVFLISPLVKRYGRKKLCFVVSIISGLLCCSSGILQYLDKTSFSSLGLKIITLMVSLCAKVSVTAIFFASFIYTTELYPTVIRMKAYGFQSTMGKIGSIASPLLIQLDGLYPGSMYFTCGVFMFLLLGGFSCLKETKGLMLQDLMSEQIIDHDSIQ